MGLVKKTVNITDQQNDWMKAQIERGLYGNDSEIVRELIRERQLRELETATEIAAIRASLIEGEQSGAGSRSIDAIWEASRKQRRKA